VYQLDKSLVKHIFILPLGAQREDIPAMFRRAAINAALGSARSFSAALLRWQKHKEKALAKDKKFHERPPVPPRTWNKSATFYAGMWKDRTDSSVTVKVWTGSCWSWIRVRITGRAMPEGWQLCSPQLVHRGGRWYLHTPALPATEREEQSSGVGVLQEPKDEAVGHSSLSSGHESSNEHGTAQDSHPRMVGPAVPPLGVRDITNPRRPQIGRSYAPTAQGSDYVGMSESAGL